MPNSDWLGVPIEVPGWSDVKPAEFPKFPAKLCGGLAEGSEACELPDCGKPNRLLDPNIDDWLLPIPPGKFTRGDKYITSNAIHQMKDLAAFQADHDAVCRLITMLFASAKGP